MTWTRASLTKQLTSGVAVFVHVCRQRVNTSNNCCDIISRLIRDKMFRILSNMILFRKFNPINWLNLDF